MREPRRGKRMHGERVGDRMSEPSARSPGVLAIQGPSAINHPCLRSAWYPGNELACSRMNERARRTRSLALARSPSVFPAARSPVAESTDERVRQTESKSFIHSFFSGQR